jgi:hypothetical protein
MSQVRKPKRKFGEFIMAYRKIIILGLFFVLLPIVVVIGVYTGTKANGEKIYFQEVTPDHHLSKKFINVEDFTTFNFDVEYTQVEPLYDKEDTEKVIGKKYSFNLTYTKNVVDIKDVKVTPVLVAPWSTYKAFKNQMTLREGSKQLLQVDFEKMTPYAPLWFVNVDNPILYFQVNYKNTQDLPEVAYLFFDLTNSNPKVIE